MKVAIHQPDYLPWLAYFDKMKRADLFVFLDCAQYTKNGFHNRNKIKVSNGWTYLTIPIQKSEHFKDMNKVCLPQDKAWQQEHYKSIATAYSNAPHFGEHQEFFKKLYLDDNQFLAEMDIKIITYLKEAFGLKAKLVRESELDIDHSLKKTERLIAILQAVKATEYLSGPSGETYMDLEQFKKAGIAVSFQHYSHPKYKQMFGEFLPGLSIIDLLFNEGGSGGEMI